MCCRGIPVKAQAPGTWIRGEQLKGPCTVAAEWFELGPMPCSDEYFVQQLCQHNQTLAARNRVVADWGIGDIDLRLLKPLFDGLASYLGVRRRCDPMDWLVQYKGGKLQQYLRALESLDDHPLRRRDGYVKAFVKAEKLTDPLKDPRMIQFRGPRYNIELGNYLKALEHDLYHVRGWGRLSQWFPASRLIVKGMCPVARGAHLEKMWFELKRPVQLNLDCSRFDGHVSEALLRLEHSVYLKCFRNDPMLQRLLLWQRDNKCFTKDGVKYSVKGNRMSGDMNTALGNCVLMVAMIGAAMKYLGVKPKYFRLADDGDDCCLLVEEQYARRVQRWIRGVFRLWGHDLKVESVARELNEVELCGCKPIRVGGVRKMILNPRRAIGKARLALKFRSTKFQRDYVATVGECLLALHTGVPVLQAHALALMRVGNHLKYRPRSWDYKLAHAPDLARSSYVTDEARFDFYCSFGISISDQIAYERWFDNVEPLSLLGVAPCPEVP